MSYLSLYCEDVCEIHIQRKKNMNNNNDIWKILKYKVYLNFSESEFDKSWRTCERVKNLFHTSGGDKTGRPGYYDHEERTFWLAPHLTMGVLRKGPFFTEPTILDWMP